MKKIFAVLLALAMLFSFAACGDDNPDKPKTSGNSEGSVDACNA